MNEGSQRTGDSVHEVISAYAGMVYRLAYARTGNRADAEDVFQEVFLKYCAAGKEFASEEHRKAWLIRATVNASADVFRSAWRRLVRTAAEVPETPAAPEKSARSEALMEALRRLPGRDRAVIFLYYYEEMRTEEIAEALGMKPSTVRSRLARARCKLKRLLAGKGECLNGQA